MLELATIARPYAKAMFSLAEEKAQIANWQTGLAQLAWIVQQPQMRTFVSQSNADTTKKADELVRLLDNDATTNVEFRNFVYLVVQEKRLAVLPEIYKQYKQLVLTKNKTKDAVIYSAYEIPSEGQRAKIISDLEQRFNIRLQARFEIDRKLIGGIKVVIGDQVLDLSIQGKLQELYATMMN